MDRLRALQRNPKLLFFAKAFMEFKTMNAVITLFYLHRGVTIDRIFWLSIVWSLTALIFEVPTGYLADRFGRKRTLLLGELFLISASIASFFAHGFVQFSGVFVLMSLGFACFSGTQEALLYDTLRETGDEKRMMLHNGRLYAAEQFFKIILPTIGAFIAKDLLEWQFATLLCMDIIGLLISTGFLFLICEPRHVQNVAEQEKGIFRQSIETIREAPVLFRLALNKLLVFIASFLLWRIYQSYLIVHGVSTWWLGFFYFLMNGVLVLLFWKLHVLERRFGLVRFLRVTAAIGLVFLLVIPFLEAPAALFVCTFLAIVSMGVREPVFSDAMNKLIRSKSRATTLSNLNMLKSVLDIPILLMTGWLAAKDPRTVFFVAAVLCGIALFLFPVRSNDVGEQRESPMPAL